jgi:hypothetical protein
VFILKLVKVLCFDTLLQVLILKEFEGDIIRCNLVPHPSTALGVKRYPYPRCFAKRVCKLLKTKGTSAEKRAKRKQEAASR